MNYIFNSSNFEIIDVIDQSSQYKAYLVKQKNSNSYYIANTLFLKLDDENSKSRFELYALKYVKIRHLTLHSLMGYSFYDFDGQSNPTLFYSRLINIMKFDDKLKFMKNTQSNTEYIIIFLGVIAGLSFLHNNEIILGDFNTSVLFIKQNLYPFFGKIGYYDLFKNESDYPFKIKPPELLSNSSHNFTKETDIYFFGIILFSIFTGQLVEKALPDFPPSINSNIKELIKKCWNEDPQNRPKCDEIFEWFDSNIKSLKPYDNDKFQKYFQLLFELPRNTYESLTIENQKHVRYASYNDEDSSFYVGKNFLLGENFFPQNIEIGLSYIRKLNQKENPKSLHFTGYLHETGKLGLVFKHDKSIAIGYYEKAAKLGNIESIDKLSQIYSSPMYSMVNSSDDKRSNLIDYCEKVADSGNDEGLYLLGTFYDNGSLIDRDEKVAFEYFTKSAEKGNVKALIKSGIMLHHGIGTEKNVEEASKYLSKAAALDPLEGSYFYGCLLNDEGTSLCNKEEARRQFEISLKNGNSKALKFLDSSKATIESLDEIADYGYDIQTVYFDRMKALNGDPKSIKKFAHFIYKHPKLEPDQSSQMVFFKLASELNDPIGQLKYGEFLTKSKKKEDISKGIQLVKDAADSGNLEAINLYAFFNFNNNLNHKNLKESLTYYLKSAEKNCLTGLVNAGFLLQNCEEGDGIQSNPIEAVRLFKKAAEMGNPIGLFHYGEALLSGEGVEQNSEEAIKMFQMAADKGDSDSMVELGNLYEIGEGFKRNPQKALRLYKKAAEMENSEGMAHYAMLSEKYVTKIQNRAFLNQIGEDVEEDEIQDNENNDVESENIDELQELSMNFLKSAVDNENINAISLYGEHLLHGIKMQHDYELAIRYFKKAIDYDSSAMCNYGMMFETGIGMENVKNYKKAKELYEKAISSDETFGMAMFHIGLMKLNGHEYDVDYNAAESFFRAAIEDGYDDASFALGWMYENGIGVEKKDSKEAFNLYKKSAANGSVYSLIGLAKCFNEGNETVKKNHELTISILNYVQQNRSLDEIVVIGKCFENGEAAPKDLEYAELCFKFAADNNSTEGIRQYNRFLNRNDSKINK